MNFFRPCRNLMLLAWVLGCFAPAAAGFDAARAGFVLAANDQVLEYRNQSLFVLPGERVLLTRPPRPADRRGSSFTLDMASGRLERRGPSCWTWRAPDEPGLVRGEVRTSEGGRMALRAFVLVPYGALADGRLDGYRIGAYPDAAGKDTLYGPPRGFVRVTAANRDTLVSPHFRLGQFLCKQTECFPQFLVLDHRLLAKLERLLQAVNEAGIPAETLAVMSGYRTPHYNKHLGNVRFSSHCWGRAADVFIDRDRNGFQDDVTGDGRADYRDVQVLHTLVDRLDRDDSQDRLRGGLGLYGANDLHGPFVHLDVRGHRARWGKRVGPSPWLTRAARPGSPKGLRDDPPSL